MAILTCGCEIKLQGMSQLCVPAQHLRDELNKASEEHVMAVIGGNVDEITEAYMKYRRALELMLDHVKDGRGKR